MQDEDLRVAVVGAGIMGGDHIERLTHKVSGARVVAVVEPDDGRAAAALTTAPGARQRATIEDALAHDDVDAVLVANPGPFHEATLLPCLEAGVPTLCEKPLTPDSPGALRVMEAEQRAGRPLIQVGFMRRYDAEHRQLRELVESGDAGALLALHCAHRNVSTPPGYVESMLITDSVVHEIDTVAWLAGEPIAAVEVKRPRRNSRAPEGLHEPQLVLLETASGVLADVEINVNCGFGYQVTTDAVFESALATIGRTAGITQWRDGRMITAEHTTYTTRFEAAYDVEVQHWVDAARRGAVDGPTAWDGYLAAVVCEAALEAQATGRRIEVSRIDRPDFYAA
ncbi:Gfo/Idh/MocA family protein [Isoptericola croceus]|uniref:Gfo/Idh/MocA family protein n=1 Tax=Isoptericola croceus TaxID=3031406 RepID=UPI0023F8A241|nr:Gfo/Idh/MocA family oxidoreductase [Isoptericola croceus]